MAQSFIQDFNRFSEEHRFSDAARIARNPALMDMVQAVAQEAAEAFPDKLNNLIVLPVPGWGAPLFATNKVMEELAEKVLKDKNLAQDLRYNPTAAPQLINSAIEELIRKATRALDEKTRISGTVAIPEAELDGIPVKIIALASSDHFRVRFPERYTDEMAAAATIDRAIGQIVLQDEDAAAAYEALRQRQRFPGKDSSDYALYRREAAAASIILNGDISRYTADSLDDALKAADKLGDKFYKLTPPELMARADKISDDSFMSAETLFRIQKAYKPVTDYYQKNLAGDDTDVLKEVYTRVIDIMRENQADPEVFRAGQRFLSAPQTQAFLLENAREFMQRSVLDFVNNHDPKLKMYQPRHAAKRHQP